MILLSAKSSFLTQYSPLESPTTRAKQNSFQDVHAKHNTYIPFNHISLPFINFPSLITPFPHLPHHTSILALTLHVQPFQVRKS